jgi:hypothetical protein
MTKEENYKLMDSSDKIPHGWDKFPWSTYVAFDLENEIIAAGNFQRIYYKAVSRGCNTPHILRAIHNIHPESVKEHNNLLEKALSSKETPKK